MKISIVNMQGSRCGEMELSDKVFKAQVNEKLVTDVVLKELANKRSGTASTKTRADVSGGGKKPWKQKGTGRARQGSIRSPQWRHGGIVFGPHPRDYYSKINGKVKKIAYRSVLSEKVSNNQLIILEELKMDKIKTKAFVEILENLDVLGTALVVMNKKDDIVVKSSKNVNGIKLVPCMQFSVHDILNYEKLLITKEAAEFLDKTLKKG